MTVYGDPSAIEKIIVAYVCNDNNYLVNEILSILDTESFGIPIELACVTDNNATSTATLSNNKHQDEIIFTNISDISAFIKQIPSNQGLIIVGSTLADQLAVSRQARTVTVLTGPGGTDPIYLPGHAAILRKITQRSVCVLFGTESARSNAEAISPTLCERNYVFRLNTNTKRGEYPTATLTKLVQPISLISSGVSRLLAETAKKLLTTRFVPESQFVKDDYAETPQEVLSFPSATLSRASKDLNVSGSYCIFDDHGMGYDAPSLIASEALSVGLFPLALSKISPSLLAQAIVEEQVPIEKLPNECAGCYQYPSLQEVLLKVFPTNPKPRPRIRVVLAGADFKFAAPVLSALQEPDFEFVLDRFEHNNHDHPIASTPLLEWSDLVVCEFLTKAAVWYSNNVAAKTRLIIHMHGFEIYGPYARELNIEHVDGIVVPSSHYRRLVVEHLSWPEEKVLVVPNAVSKYDLLRPKVSDARFRIGLAGWVPTLKRIDRAIDLLEHLVAVDDRYQLEIRGVPAWNYRWEWAKPSHQAAYMAVIERVQQSSLLQQHITFEPFGADVGNWLRSIGWILSPSTRETFHLAPVEGMLSGAIPLIWNRKGAVEVFGEDWIVNNVEEATTFILKNNQTEADWDHLRTCAREFALNRYEADYVSGQWKDYMIAITQSGTTTTFPAWLNESIGYTAQGDFKSALDLLGLDHQIAPGSFASAHVSFVRGHQLLAERITSVEYRVPEVTAGSHPNRFLLVKSALPHIPLSADNWGAVGIAAVAPPPGSSEKLRFNPSLYSNFAPLIPIIGADPDTPARFDRYVNSVANELVDLANNLEAVDFVAQGTYWTVLPCLQAAKITGGEVWWDTTLLETPPMRATRITAFSNNPLEILSSRIAQECAGVIVGSTASSTFLSDWHTDRIIEDFPSQIIVRKHIERPSDIAAVLYVGDAGIDSFTTTSSRFRLLPCAALADINNDQTYSGVLLDTDSILGRIETRKILTWFRKLRAKGLKIIVIESANTEMLDTLLSFYAEADGILTRTYAGNLKILSLQSYRPLQISPFSQNLSHQIVRAIETMLELSPGSFPVEPHSTSIEEITIPSDTDKQEITELSSTHLPSISVIIPAYRSDGSLFVLLESLIEQTISHSFVEIIVILNGPATKHLAQLTKYASNHSSFKWHILESAPGASRARNVGLSRASGDMIVFADDDDLLERNYLLSLAASWDPSSIVVTDMTDLDAAGIREYNTNTTMRTKAIGFQRVPAYQRAGLLSTIAAKGIPRHLLQRCRFDENLTSGEDIAFFAPLAANPDVFLSAAFALSQRAYLRSLREESVSRRSAVTFDFGCFDRLKVIEHVWNAISESQVADAERVLSPILTKPQLAMIENYLKSHPASDSKIRQILTQYDHPFCHYLVRQTKTDFPYFHRILTATPD